MTLNWMNYTHFDEYIAESARWSGLKRTWVTLAGDLLHQGNILKHGDFRVSAFDSIATPRRHMVAWLFEDATAKFGEKDEILLYRDAEKRLQSICDDPYQWSSHGVPLPEVLNTFCKMVQAMDEGTAFYQSEDETDYMGGQVYQDTLWYTGEYHVWSLVHSAWVHDFTPCSCDHDDCRFLYECEDNSSTEETNHVRWVYEPVKDYLFKLHAKRSLVKFEPCQMNANEKKFAETRVRIALGLPELKTAES